MVFPVSRRLCYLNDILIEYRGAKEEVVVPEHIKYITAGAFKDNSAVKSIIFPQDMRFYLQN